MRPVVLLVLAAVLAGSLALAQTVQTVQPIRAVQPAPAVQPQVVQPVAEQGAPQYVDRTAQLEAQNKHLRESNLALKQENAQLKARMDAMTTRGGSEVRAWCPAATVSRNTAGATANCATAGYTCEPVSGLCRTSCQTSDMCAGGFTCDVGAGKCVHTGG